MNSFIDQNICSKCSLCSEVCPCKIIQVDFGGNVDFIKERESLCLHCGQCMAICSTGAVKISDLAYGEEIVELPANSVNNVDFTGFLMNRRSVRNFKAKPVEDEKLEKILDSINYAPFGAEPEKVSITVVNSREKIERTLPYIEKFLDDIVSWIKNPVVRFMIRRANSEENFNTVKNHLYPMAKAENYKLKHGDSITRGAPSILVFHAEKGAEAHTNNILIYATYAMLAAHSLGLGATMIEIVPHAINRVKEVRSHFQIPENHEAVMSLVVGYPRYKYKRTVRRKAQEINWLT